MYFKIAAVNIKKSYKDYTIYFLTLILAVCIFYSFNSIDSQKALAEINSLDAEYISRLIDFMSGVSLLVSIILGGLILYANNFLIKKRKKELGIYMILGMGKRKISRILVTETSIVGAISLVAGLILGIGVSQGLSTFTLKLFDVGMDEYRFAVSTSAIGKTILYFGIMFLLVMIFNVFVISKYNIIDLLTAGRKGENIKFKSPFIYLLSFILCVISLGFAYKSILEIGLDLREPMFKLSIAVAIICTIVFFFSLSGFILYVVNKNKKVYFKGLNIFVLKQINSKVNTNFLSMALISIMLFITIVVLSIGISFKKDSEAGLEKTTPFDASIILSANDENKNIEDILNKIDFKISGNETYATYNEYVVGIKLKDLFTTEDETLEGWGGTFIKISDYNKILELKGEKEINLNKDEVLLLSNYNKLVEPINEKLKISNEVNIKGKEYLVKNDKAIEENLQTSSSANTYCTIVINDKFLSDYKIYKSVLNIMYSDNNREENNKKYEEINENSINGKHKILNVKDIDAYSKDGVYSRYKGASTTILFIGIYLGIVFLITSMAVLALQQLSEASDSIERYKALKRLGANKKMIDKTIFIQTLIYFSLPVILALIHSVVGIVVVNDYISNFNPIDIRSSALITALIFIIVYIGYFYTTYSGYKNIVKNNI
ncbi:FtsX-like permease family protein [Clostridium gasigenes]|uniref:Putative ABC transport system permease protein n=1 Tax=Clostridium gasigenes TaxID=94869 RepID=A0A1H0QD40_9CLOT|nr:FtsX-like permease family protein [Clostridium gasigenes]MBB6623363.1 FtsX-like permease family protein [Clostridium gasigenes]MBU3088012.1 FtsX-like permease family protein [Clostridium gasigenes]SDP14609.1 putative ABC transport system permease protein [Clostridium gasigenes]